MVEKAIQRGMLGVKDKKVEVRRGPGILQQPVVQEVPLTPSQQSYVDEQNARDAAEAAAKTSKDLGDFLARRGPKRPTALEWRDRERARELRGED